MKAVKLAALMVFQYVLLVANMRFVAQGRIVPTIATDIVIATVGWTLTKSVASAESWQERAGFVAGAALGSAVGIWLT